ncbi:MAG: BolA/IbaG family iron-sulfur metabolism protein [Pseudohongiellaceae bacterium]
MSVQSDIENKVREHFSPAFLQVENESHRHSGPATESHFKLTVVSDRFEGLRLVARHQKLYHLLQDELNGGVHALALHTYTSEEWRTNNGNAPASPECRGGSKTAS